MRPALCRQVSLRCLTRDLAQVEAGELAPERGAEFVGNHEREKCDADRDGEIFGDFDPEMSVDHDGFGPGTYAMSIVLTALKVNVGMRFQAKKVSPRGERPRLRGGEGANHTAPAFFRSAATASASFA